MFYCFINLLFYCFIVLLFYCLIYLPAAGVNDLLPCPGRFSHGENSVRLCILPYRGVGMVVPLETSMVSPEKFHTVAPQRLYGQTATKDVWLSRDKLSLPFVFILHFLVTPTYQLYFFIFVYIY